MSIRRLFATLAVAVVFAGASAAHAMSWSASCGTVGDVKTCTWSEAPLAVADDPTFKVSGSATFEVTGDQLKIVLTAANGSAPTTANWQTLTGITFDLAVAGIALDPISATVAPGSSLVDPASGGTDVSDYWAYRGDLTSPYFGEYGFSAIGGEAPFLDDAFGHHDIIGPNDINGQPGGVDYGLLPPDAVLSSSSLNQGPFVQNQLVLLADISSGPLSVLNSDGPLSVNDIGFVVPIYGSDGVPPMPEPSSALLFATGFLVVGSYLRRRSLP
jgi:hypothetical protein